MLYLIVVLIYSIVSMTTAPYKEEAVDVQLKILSSLCSPRSTQPIFEKSGARLNEELPIAAKSRPKKVWYTLP